MVINGPSLQEVQDNHAKSFLTAKVVYCAAKIIGYARMNARGPDLVRIAPANTSVEFRWNAGRVFVITKTRKCLI